MRKKKIFINREEYESITSWENTGRFTTIEETITEYDHDSGSVSLRTIVQENKTKLFFELLHSAWETDSLNEDQTEQFLLKQVMPKKETVIIYK